MGPAKPKPANVIAPDTISVVPPPCILAEAAPIAPNAMDLVAQPLNLFTLPKAAPSSAPIAVSLATCCHGFSYAPKNPTVPKAIALAVTGADIPAKLKAAVAATVAPAYSAIIIGAPANPAITCSAIVSGA